jgi:hypothetical protein
MPGGSTGKTVFAATAVSLALEGIIRLDDKLSLWLGHEPWYSRLPNAADISLRHLLTHTAGVPDHMGSPDTVNLMREMRAKYGQLKHYSAAVEKYVVGDWEGAIQKAGKFVEAVTKALFLFCGGTIASARQFKAGNELRQLENRAGYPDAIRISVPRAAAAVYEIANNRGARHDPHDIEANEMDAPAVMPGISWVLAELIRFAGAGDPASAMAMTQEFTRKRYPHFEEISGRPYVNLDGTPGEIALLILYSIYPKRIRRSELVEMVKKHGASQSAATAAVHRIKHLIDDENGMWLLRGAGRQEAETVLQRLAG